VAFAGAVMGAFVGFMKVGTIFATEPLKPQLKKLNPIEGLKNMFKAQTVIELFKNIAKITIVFYMAYSTVKDKVYTMLQTSTISIENSAKISGDILFHFILKVLLAFLVITVIDFMLRRRTSKQMKMTKDEVKRSTSGRGDPHAKGASQGPYTGVRVQRPEAGGKAERRGAPIPPVAVCLKYDREAMAARNHPQRTGAFAEMIKGVYRGKRDSDHAESRSPGRFLSWKGVESQDLYNAVAGSWPTSSGCSR
jgi:type III secretory pathway component EscU